MWARIYQLLKPVWLTATGIVLSGQTVPTGSGSSIVVNTHKGNATGLSSIASSSFATINKRMQGKTSLIQVQTVSTKICVVRNLLRFGKGCWEFFNGSDVVCTMWQTLIRLTDRPEIAFHNSVISHQGVMGQTISTNSKSGSRSIDSLRSSHFRFLLALWKKRTTGEARVEKGAFSACTPASPALPLLG